MLPLLLPMRLPGPEPVMKTARWAARRRRIPIEQRVDVASAKEHHAHEECPHLRGDPIEAGVEEVEELRGVAWEEKRMTNARRKRRWG